MTTFSSDQPISSKKEDLLGRASFALRIADIIAARKDSGSIALGIYGAWGDGKTSVLEMISEALKDHKHVVTIKFNPWLFPSEELLLREFFSSLAQGLGESLPSKKETIGKAISAYASIFSAVPISLGGIVSVNPAAAVEKIGEKMSQTNLGKQRQRIEEILEENKRRVVVFIDDIDRLDKDETHAVFKLVKLTASFRYTTYVLAFDHEIVAAALGERYAQGGKTAGEAFLEKIIQVPLHLPAADANKLRQITLQGVESALDQAKIELTPQQEELFLYCFANGLAPRLKTPRLSRLYCNTLLFSLPLLKGEVNPVDHMLIEGVRICYPGLYKQIRKTPQFFLTGKPSQIGEERSVAECHQFAKNLLAECLPELTSFEHQEILDTLIPNFLPGLFGHGQNKDADIDKRISSPNYFRKYFMYSVPSDDLSDVQLECFLAELAQEEEVISSSWFNDACSNGHSRSVVRKLLDRLATLDERSSQRLLAFMINNLNKIDPSYEPFSSGNSSRAMTRELLTGLFKKMPDTPDREKIVMDFVTNAEPLGFVASIFYWGIRFTERHERTRILPMQVEEKALLALATRISDLDKATPLYRHQSDQLVLCYLIIGDTLGYSELTERLKPRFDSSPKEVDLFLQSLARLQWVLGRNEPECGYFDKDKYKFIAKMIDPQYIMDNLVERFGDEVNKPVDRSEDIDPKLKIARQFAEQHREALSQNLAG